MVHANRRNKSSRDRVRDCSPGNGFTLIELLVVVAIIALLISILLPSLGRARGQAQKVVCASRMRQMGMAVFLYATEYDQWLTPGSYFGNQRKQWTQVDNGWNNDSPPWYPAMWCQVLVPYSVGTTNNAPWTPGVIKTTGFLDVWGSGGNERARRTLFWCAQDPRDPSHTTSSNPDDGLGVSYAPLTCGWPPSQMVNGKLVPGAPGGSGTVLGHKVIELVTPGDAAMIVEGWNTSYPFHMSNGNIQIFYGGYLSSSKQQFQDNTLASFRYRHNNLTNVLFADNHVSALRAGDLPPQGTAAAPQRFWGFGEVTWGY